MPSEALFSGFRRHFYLNPGKVVFRFKYRGLTKTSTALRAEEPSESVRTICTVCGFALS
ncbi:hypothetical protein [Neisseria meningitidis]|uniref:hypothetical protein n=1 Tax=Neisseria meningitidis TaxID=487 RepID=UPI00164018D1|nr:hypothetical protein [Neisseria meningitidis]